MNVTGHTSRNLPIKPLPVAPEDIAAHARIERALGIIHKGLVQARADMLSTRGEARQAYADQADLLLDLRNVLETKR